MDSHFDFSRQVTRSARAVEGALLLVDATRGVQAQTLGSVELALAAGLELHPVINKVDLPTADVERTQDQISTMIGLDGTTATLTSAKLGTGVNHCLDAVIKHLPPPVGDSNTSLNAILFDSYFDPHRGVVLLLRVFHGVLRCGDVVTVHRGNKGNDGTANARRGGSAKYTIDGLGLLTPGEVRVDELGAGEIGVATAAIRGLSDVPVGSTISLARDDNQGCNALTVGENDRSKEDELVLESYESQKPLVFCGIYPSEAGDFGMLRKALDKLQLQDGSLWFEAERCGALGSGFRCGFLGLLHMSVTLERLEREFGVSVISSAPSVPYRIRAEESKEWKDISSPSDIPSGRVGFQELFAKVDILCAHENVGAMLELVTTRRGILKDQRSVGTERARIVAEVPVSEVVSDLHDAVKSRSSGFASMAYETIGFQASPLVRMDIRVSGDDVPGLASVVHVDRVQRQARRVVQTLKELIPRQMFKVAIQAVVQGKVLASEHIPAFRKDVTAKCYGGDASRKKKLLKKQAEGKKRMKKIGKVSIPQEAFLAIVKQ